MSKRLRLESWHDKFKYLFLFAGALTVNLDDLNKQKWVVLTLATVGVLTSTFVVGGLVYLMAELLGLELPVLDFSAQQFVPALLIIPLVLLGRLFSVGIPIGLFRLRRNVLPYTVRMMVWGACAVVFWWRCHCPPANRVTCCSS